MKAIILAAGIGNRMRPLTDSTHKTLLKIGESTLIDRILISLAENGISDVVIVTGYREKELTDYVKKNNHGARIQFVHNPRFQETNNIHSLALAFKNIKIDDDIMLIESDLVYEPAVIKRLLQSKGENVALVDKFRSGMDGTVVTVSNNIITSIIPPHLQDSDFDFSDKYKSLNIYKFSKDFCNNSFKKLLSFYSQVLDDNCYYELVLGMLIYVQKEQIYGEILSTEKWTEIDDPNDLSLAKFMFDPAHQFEVLENDFGGLWNHTILDFYYIRNIYFPNDSIIAELKNNLPKLLHNYGTRQDVLNQKLAHFLLQKKECLNVFNGISQLYPLLKQYLSHKKVLIPRPTFGEYPRIFSENHTYSDMVGFNTSEIEDKAKDCDAVVFVNPNNPTGSILETQKIYEFALKNTNKSIIIDESFIDFSDQPSMTTLLEKEPLTNCIVIKSLSKVLGVPGLRLGYTYCSSKQFTQFIKDALPIWNINSMAEFFLEIILKHRGLLAQSYEKTKRDRDHFHSRLTELPFIDQVFPGQGNFILVKFKNNAADAQTLTRLLLSKYTIFVKDISPKFNDGRLYFRIAVREPKENEYFVKCLKELCGGK